MRARTLVSRFFSSIVKLTPEERAVMIENRNPLGTTIEAAAKQIRLEIQTEGLEPVKLKLAKEKLLEQELAAELYDLDQKSITVAAESFKGCKNIKESVDKAINRINEEGLDYKTNHTLIVAQSSLATRQLALKYNPDLLDISYNNDVYSINMQK